ncbi:uncharacterized protein GGS22DRAFT_47581 [Annulohypoxylon maeteangense]|uniref:uncharacterized protein n=1 Tax=Annulohypoxylon maeteangense TaxID=1927788 RepID=UPI0020086334|nr:uncharacterized protein GGS22DRAFT_47581 [Annulohypoxylon maeteangense]KAI0882661.1 hypothetical protein GGS22DRAFT_47581 [Annulohypoxylon maeteangense]
MSEPRLEPQLQVHSHTCSPTKSLSPLLEDPSELPIVRLPPQKKKPLADKKASTDGKPRAAEKPLTSSVQGAQSPRLNKPKARRENTPKSQSYTKTPTSQEGKKKTNRAAKSQPHASRTERLQSGNWREPIQNMGNRTRNDLNSASQTVQQKEAEKPEELGQKGDADRQQSDDIQENTDQRPHGCEACNAQESKMTESQKEEDPIFFSFNVKMAYNVRGKETEEMEFHATLTPKANGTIGCQLEPSVALSKWMQGLMAKVATESIIDS